MGIPPLSYEKQGFVPSLSLGRPPTDWPSEDELTALGPSRRELLVPEGFNWSLSCPVGRVDCPGTRLEGVPAGGERMLMGWEGVSAGGEGVPAGGEGVLVGGESVPASRRLALCPLPGPRGPGWRPS